VDAVIGCWIDSHHGHYAIPEVIRIGHSFGYVLTDVERYVVAAYDRDNHRDDYPHEFIIELSEQIIDWLNSYHYWSAAGYAPNGKPPEIPVGSWWGWNDGDFGLYDEREGDE
jgi:hypothetical protein